MKTLSLAVLILVSIPGAADTFNAAHYEIGSGQKNILYTSKRTETTEGDTTKARVVFSDPMGKPVVIEDVVTTRGKLVRYSQEQKQLNQSGLLEVKDGRVNFSYTKDGKTTTDDEKAKSNLVVGPTLMDYVKENWNTILSGHDLEVRFAVLDRKETVGFKLFKIGESKVGGRETITVKMKPTSIIIAALVDPLIFQCDRQNVHALEIIGRTLPKKHVDGKWKDLDADSIYTF